MSNVVYNGNDIVTNLGGVTAYADAVKAGYTGTREQFAEDMAKLGGNVAEVRESRAAAEAAASRAEASENEAKSAAGNAQSSATAAAEALNKVTQAGQTAVQNVDAAKEAAVNSVNNAGNNAVSAVDKARNDAIDAVNGSRDDAVTAVENKGDAAISELETAKGGALDAIDAEKRTSVQEVESAGRTAVSGIATAKTASIEAVSAAEGAAIDAIAEARSASLNDIASASEGAVSEVNAAADARIEEINAMGVDGTVRFDEDQRLTEAQRATARSNIGASGAIVETVSGDAVVTLNDSANAALHGLRIFGRSTQDGTPAPEAPVPIVSAGDDGSIDMRVTGKNLFNGGELITHTGRLAVQFETPLPPGTYTLSGIIETNDTDGTNSLVGLATQNGTEYAYLSRNVRDSVTITINDISTTIYINPSNSVANSKDDTLTVKMFQIEHGAEMTAYEPYKSGGTLTYPTPNGLPGVPVTSGGNYTDANGQQWVCDEVDFGRGVYIKRTDRVVFDGSADEAWTLNSSGVFSSQAVAKNFNKLFKPLCSHYPTTITMSSTSLPDKTFAMYNNDTPATVNVFNNWIRDSSYATVDELTAALSESPVTAVYTIKPIETPLSESELAAYRALRTQYPTTNVTNDEGIGMEVSYTADTKTYIDNKFAELSAAILNSNA